MGLLNKGITIINFDETYKVQEELQHYRHENLDFQQLEHVNLFCEEDSLHTLEKRIKNRKQKGITFIGSGNYHYISYVLLKEMTKPFTLVLFDNHPDLGTGNGPDKNMLTCGSWVYHALNKIPLLQQVVIIGPTVVLANQSTNPRTVIFPFDGAHHYSFKTILSAIPTENVYISIDKDVLNTDNVVTNWDQGMMDISTLTSILEHILKNKQVEGVDICGEERLTPAQILRPEVQRIIHKNEHANVQILETCLKMSHSQYRGA